MGDIVHLAVDTERARIRPGGERGDDPARLLELPLRRREAAINGRDLVDMDRDAPE